MSVRRSGLRAVAAVLATLVVATGVRAAPAEPPLPALDEVQRKLARVAGLYRDAALRFTCDETVSSTGHGPPTVHKYRYIYRHSSDDALLLDYREPRGRVEGRSEDRVEQARIENAGLPSFVLRAYSWAFIFSEENQQFHRYELDGWDEIGRARALRLRFTALPPYRNGINEWLGRAWIDPSTYQVMRVEAVYVDDREEYELMRLWFEEPDDPRLEFRRAFTFSTITTDFDVRKNGMRFPGRVLIRRARHHARLRRGRPRIEEHPIYEVIQTYKRYRFFNVRTAQQIERIVAGD